MGKQPKLKDQAPPPSTEEGWYPDPLGTPNTERKWDGSKWTPYTQSTGSSPAAVASPSTGSPAPPTASNRGPKKTGWKGVPVWAWIAAGVVLLFVIAGIFGDSDSDKSDSGDAPKEKEAAEKPAAATGTTPAPPADPLKAFGEDQFGDKFKTDEKIGSSEVIYTFKQGDTIDYAFTIEEEFKDAYEAAFKNGDLPANINTITLIADIDLVDKFGKELDGPGYSVTMKRGVGEQINWDNKDILEFGDLWHVNLMREDL